MAIGEKKPVLMASDRGKPSGVAALGPDGKLEASQIPAVKLLGAAPDGFGLGTEFNSVTDADTVQGNGFWAAKRNTPRNDWGYLIQFQYDQSTATQIFCQSAGDANKTTMLYKRTKTNGAFAPWECLNPSMEAGLEYRTGEKWNGVAVWSKLTNCGAWADGKTIYDDGFKEISQLLSLQAVQGKALLPTADASVTLVYNHLVLNGPAPGSGDTLVLMKYHKVGG